MKNRRADGATFESRARQLLENSGLSFVEANFQCRLGEIDLIMRDGEMLVFVEVRARRSHQHVSAVESIDFFKRQRLRRAAEIYLQRNGLNHPDCRFDVVAWSFQNGAPDADWIQGAF